MKRPSHNYGFLSALLACSALSRAYQANLFRADFSDPALLGSGMVPNFGMFAGYLYRRACENLLSPIMLHMFYDLFRTIAPLGAEMGDLPTGSVSILRMF